MVHFTLGIGKPWHWFATWLVVDLMPLWTDLRERLPPTPGGLHHGDCAGHAMRRAILFPMPFVIVGLLVHRLFLRWGVRKHPFTGLMSYCYAKPYIGSVQCQMGASADVSVEEACVCVLT